MSSSNNITDDYVAAILQRDAEKERQTRLFGPLLTNARSRPRSEAPKPNQRFLKNLVRDVDSHNAALKAKEEEDAAKRLRDLKRGQERSPKRKRDDTKDGNPNRWRNVLGGIGAGREKRRDEKSGAKHEEKDRHRRRRHRDRESRSRSRSRSPRRRREQGRERDRSSDHKSKRRRRHSSSSPERSSHRHRTQKHSSRKSPSPRRPSPQEQNPDSDSDPLACFIGPKPPSKSTARGRGANKTSNIDDRFAASYDPRADVDLDPDEAEGDDWDMALEAFRDRAKWRQAGAERLKAAGFTDAEVENWEKGTGGGEKEKDVRDVKWRKKGEGREWDAGKVGDGEESGGIAAWAKGKVKVAEEEDMKGRLKGT